MNIQSKPTGYTRLDMISRRCHDCGRPGKGILGAVFGQDEVLMATFVAQLFVHVDSFGEAPRQVPLMVSLELEDDTGKPLQWEYFELSLNNQDGRIAIEVATGTSHGSRPGLTKEEALSNPYLPLIYQIVEFIVDHERAIKQFLRGSAINKDHENLTTKSSDHSDDSQTPVLEHESNRESEIRTEFGVKRTTCSCKKCSIWCKVIPGRLIPADLKRLIPPGEDPLSWARLHLRVTPLPGLILVPARASPHGPCHWLTPDHGCAVHADSPFGCAMYSCKVSATDVKRLSRGANRAIIEDHEQKGLYTTIGEMLWTEGLREYDAMKGKAIGAAYLDMLDRQNQRKQSRAQKKKARAQKKKSKR